MRVASDCHVLVINHRRKPYYDHIPAERLCASYASRYMSIPRSGTWVGKDDDVISLERFLLVDDIMVLQLPKQLGMRRYIKTLYPFLSYNGNVRSWVFRYGDATRADIDSLRSIGASFTCKGRHGHVPTPLRYSTVDFLSLVGWYASEGYLLSNGNARTYGIIICQNNLDNQSNIVALCDCLGLHYRIDSGRKVTIVSELLYRAFGHFCPGVARTKTIVPELRQYSVRHLRSLLDALLAGDGSVSWTGARVYYTASEKLAYDVSDIAIKAGNAVKIAPQNGRGYEVGLRHATRSNTTGARRVSFEGHMWSPIVAGATNFLAVENGCFFFVGGAGSFKLK